jgi:hypothetical protein
MWGKYPKRETWDSTAQNLCKSESQTATTVVKHVVKSLTKSRPSFASARVLAKRRRLLGNYIIYYIEGGEGSCTA